MIPYQKSFLGAGLIFKVHGSPVYRGAIAGIISVVIYAFFDKYWNQEGLKLGHPYGIGVLITSASFLIVFRANYGYQRYWEACGNVHHFMSKWLDAVIHTGAYHMQCKHYNHIKPPSYFDHHDLNQLNLRRNREREEDFGIVGSQNPNEGKLLRRRRAIDKSITAVDQSSAFKIGSGPETHPSTPHTESSIPDSSSRAIRDPQYLLGEGRKDGGWGSLFDDKGSSTFYDMNDPTTWYEDRQRGFASEAGGRTPALFLQELVHLTSLLTAVAMSTLRNDIEGAPSPLGIHIPGSDFPEVDPDQDRSFKALMSDTIRYVLGFERTIEERTKYNARRPFPVIGGVSKNEIEFLQRAKGPSAKVTLCWHWVSEFVIREHLAGTLGAVGPPIISRIFQFLSDGMIFYNHARKTMFIPFPFPHAQISAFFVLTITATVPILMDEYSNSYWLGMILTFLTVTCLAGLHEVARELENPYKNVPNEIPLVTLCAMFNESLITMFAGYHPDHFWDADDFRGLQQPVTATVDGGAASSKKQSSNGGGVGSKSKAVGGTKTMSVKELQSLVEKQAEELERLSNKLGGTGSLPDLSQCMK